MTRKRTFFFNTAVLAAGSILLRFCGLWFRSVIAGRIGAGGMGLFQLVFSVFALGVTACTSGFGLAMTRLTAEGKASRLCVRRCLCLALGLSAAALGALTCGSEFIAVSLIAARWPPARCACFRSACRASRSAPA